MPGSVGSERPGRRHQRNIGNVVRQQVVGPPHAAHEKQRSGQRRRGRTPPAGSRRGQGVHEHRRRHHRRREVTSRAPAEIGAARAAGDRTVPSAQPEYPRHTEQVVAVARERVSERARNHGRGEYRRLRRRARGVAVAGRLSDGLHQLGRARRSGCARTHVTGERPGPERERTPVPRPAGVVPSGGRARKSR